MQSLWYAFQFIGACFSLAVKNTHLRRSWLVAGLGGLLLLVTGFIPLMLVAGLLGLSPVGLILIGLFCTLLLFLLLAWGKMTALLTSHDFLDVIQGNNHPEPKSNSNLNVLVQHGLDVFVFSIILPDFVIMEKFRQLFKRELGTQFNWLKAQYLVIPVISLEDLNLAHAVERIKQIIAENLLRFRDDLVPVIRVAGLIQWILIICGIVLGFIAAIQIADPLTAANWRRILGAAVGLLAGGLPVILGIIFRNFSSACYAAALFQWVRNVESARETGETEKATPPEILRKILGMNISKNKD